jgi:DNA-binding Lrp family transcriptional regulator
MSTPAWTFLSNHSHVLVCVARNPEVTMREIASQVGITERAVQRIVDDLERDGYLVRSRVGRRNRYVVDLSLPLRHPLESGTSVETLLQHVLKEQDSMASQDGSRRQL